MHIIMESSVLRLLLAIGLCCVIQSALGQECGGVIRNVTSGTIVSPGYPSSYPSSSDCVWKVQIPNVSELKVTFTVFSVENNYDYLYYGVGQGEDTSRPIGQLTGNTLPDDIDFRVGVLWFRFTSDGSIQSDGFSFNWEATVSTLPPPTTVTTIYTSRAPIPSLPPATGEPIIGLSLFCEGTSMVAIFDKDAVSSTDPTDVRLIDENCVGQAYGDSQIAIQTDYNKCGTTMEETDDHIIFRNSLLAGAPDAASPIIQNREVNVTLECRIERRQMAQSDQVDVIGSTFTFTEVSFGNFTYFLEIFPDSSFTAPYLPIDYPVAITIGDDLFMGAKVESPRDDLELFLDRCWGTPSSDPLDANNYTLIDSGCAVDNSVQFYESADDVTQQFSFNAFAFKTGQTLVYIHCQMIVCDVASPVSECVAECGSSDSQSDMSPKDLHVISSNMMSISSN